MVGDSSPRPLRVAVVGPSAAGKSTLVKALREARVDARHVAQEHSYVPDMWQRISRPDVLVYLDMSDAAAQARRQGTWSEGRHAAEVERLSHARAHCDLYVDTSPLTPEEVRARVMDFLASL
jgi:chloramphenicol 3-O-phosphotransferase